jgi:hypothetical protein
METSMAADRSRIAMEPGEVEEFLGAAREVVVGYCAPDGWPMGVLAGAEYHDGTLTFEIPGTSREVGEGAAVCCVAEESPSYREIRGVIAHGDISQAHEVDGRWRYSVHLGRVVSFDFGRTV